MKQLILCKIVRLPVKRWKEYKELELHALRTELKAFRYSYGQILKKPADFWKKDLKTRDIFFAEINNKLVGMATLTYEESPKAKHIVTINRVYVHEDYREHGIAELLLHKIIEHVKKKEYVKELRLKVNITQKPAISLYKKLGFKRIVTLKKELKVKHRYYDEYMMEKFF